MRRDHTAVEADHGPRTALWPESARAELAVGPASRRAPGPEEVVVRVHAVAVNPVDTIGWVARRAIYPWLRYPAVLGTDVAGTVVETGTEVGDLNIGDRVVGLAAGQERDRNNPAHGAFQSHTVLPAAMTARIPDRTSSTDAVVLPLAAATAAAGLFQSDQLALDGPRRTSADRDETVLVWGGSTSVGCNAVQLARHAGYRVIATASPHNHRLLRELGAEQVVDHHAGDCVGRVRDALGSRTPAGMLAIGAGSLSRCIRIARPYVGTVRIASAQPGPTTAALGVVARLLGSSVSAIWGGSVTRDELGPSIFNELLPHALEAGTYRPAPPAEVVGSQLAAVPDALSLLRRGVSARKIVVTLRSATPGTATARFPADPG